jgi:hypothetical protein
MVEMMKEAKEIPSPVVDRSLRIRGPIPGDKLSRSRKKTGMPEWRRPLRIVSVGRKSLGRQAEV